MASVLFDFLKDWLFWVVIGYGIMGMMLGFVFGSVCGWLHPDNHILVWMIVWPVKLFNILFSTIVSKLACKKYGHVDKDYDRGCSMNSNTVDLYCNRCGKLLKIVSIDEIDDKTKEGIGAFNEIGNKMFTNGKDINLRIVK